MRTAPFVLASQHVPVKGQGKKPSDEEYEREWVLCKPTEVSYTGTWYFRQTLIVIGRRSRQHHHAAVFRKIYTGSTRGQLFAG